MKDHEIREIVNRITAVAKDFGTSGQLRAQIAAVVVPVLKQNKIPDGWQAIPKTPTAEMMSAFAGSQIEHLPPEKADREEAAFAEMLRVAPRA